MPNVAIRSRARTAPARKSMRLGRTTRNECAIDATRQAVKAAAGDAHERGGLSFIVDRFARWQRKARELEQWRAAPTVEERLEKERRDEEERARIRAEQDSPEGRELVAAAVTRLPWNVARGA